MVSVYRSTANNGGRTSNFEPEQRWADAQHLCGRFFSKADRLEIGLRCLDFRLVELAAVDGGLHQQRQCNIRRQNVFHVLNRPA